jgi:hypothetical protein
MSPDTKPSFRGRTLRRSIAFEIVQLSIPFSLSRSVAETTLGWVISLIASFYDMTLSPLNLYQGIGIFQQKRW